MLSAPADLEIRSGAAFGRLTVSGGERAAFGLHYGRFGQERPRVWSPAELSGLLADTVTAWRSWSALHQSYTGPWADLVHHSGRVLQALTFYPTGAIVAAADDLAPGGRRRQP